MAQNKYTLKWEAKPDTDRHHTALTYYVADGFKIWKGKRCIRCCFYTADEWHLIRTSDGKEIHSGKTAKECMGALEYCIKAGRDIETMESTLLWKGLKFNDDFTAYL